MEVSIIIPFKFYKEKILTILFIVIYVLIYFKSIMTRIHIHRLFLSKYAHEAAAILIII